jgi:hypothetical protein
MSNASHYKITFNGKSTYMVTDNHGTCLFAADTERKAVNFLARLLKDAGITA